MYIICTAYTFFFGGKTLVLTMPKVVQSDDPLVQASTGSQQGHDRRSNNNVFHHRRQTKWATFNVNGLRTAHKRRCLEIDLLRYDIDMLCVQELHEGYWKDGLR